MQLENEQLTNIIMSFKNMVILIVSHTIYVHCYCDLLYRNYNFLHSSLSHGIAFSRFSPLVQTDFTVKLEKFFAYWFSTRKIQIVLKNGSNNNNSTRKVILYEITKQQQKLIQDCFLIRLLLVLVFHLYNQINN